MGFERLSALVKHDGVLQIDIALLEAGDNDLEFLERRLKIHFADRLSRVLRFRYG